MKVKAPGSGRILLTGAFWGMLASLCVGAIVWSQQGARAQIETRTNPDFQPAVATCTIPNFSGPTASSLRAPRVFASGDFNKDGKLDLAVGQSVTGGSLTIMLGDGAGGFSQTDITNVMRTPAGIVVADLNGDGNADLIIGNQDRT